MPYFSIYEINIGEYQEGEERNDVVQQASRK